MSLPMGLKRKTRLGIIRADAFLKALPQADGFRCHLPFIGPLVGLIYQPLWDGLSFVD
ncbi:hypothetical protein GCM10011273_01930 [Asticcacaulis endophyticus]|uniref:Uncharacterized protein n=1 Tax=Asticcacaulis endophyticus TaxID=1395890 RepID=A0A918PTQ4_9CAUL|nr:hypothetical protein GCM10011273_01930 [Asticcacaulis endophyticus]